MRTISQLPYLVAAFLVPNSQALVNNPLAVSMNTPGYHCQVKRDLHMINIHYGASHQGLPCKVTYQRGGMGVTQLLEARRNVGICEHKAKRMAVRLIDRGGECTKVELTSIQL
ncbi:MAG: hypothetical protein AAFZ92_02880 [Pseudomonadota bacterium]